MQFININSLNPPKNPKRKELHRLDFADGKIKAKWLAWFTQPIRGGAETGA